MVDLNDVVETVSRAVSGGELAFEDSEEASFPEPPAVAVEATSADVTVVGEARSDVAVRLEKRADDPDRLDDVTITASGGGDRTLRLVVDEASDGWVTLDRLDLSLTVRVPTGVSVESVETTAGRVTVSDLAVERVQTSAGRVELTGVAGGTVETNAGRVELDASEVTSVSTSAGRVVAADSRVESITTTAGRIEIDDCAGDTTVETAAGRVAVEGLDGFLDAETAAGRIVARDVAGIDRLETDTGRIEAEVRSLRGQTRVASTAGSVSLTVASGVDAEVAVSSKTGRVTAEGFDHEPTTMGGAATATLGDGGPTLAVETKMGSITLEHGGRVSDPVSPAEVTDTTDDGESPDDGESAASDGSVDDETAHDKGDSAGNDGATANDGSGDDNGPAADETADGETAGETTDGETTDRETTDRETDDDAADETGDDATGGD